MPPKRQPRPENLVQNQGESVQDEQKSGPDEQKSEEKTESSDYKKFIKYAKKYQADIIKKDREQLEKEGLINSTALFKITTIPIPIKNILT